MRPVDIVSASKVNKLEHRRNKRLRLGRSPYKPLHMQNKIGRKDIDLEQVYQLAKMMCSQEEIGAVLGIGAAGVSQARESWPEFAEALDNGYTDTKKSLRKTQLELALSGHASMLMWLGKQYLGQADKHEQNNKTEVSITVQRAADELRNMPKDKLLAAMALLEQPVIDNETIPEAEQSQAD